MLNIQLIRSEPQAVRQALERKFADVAQLDRLVAIDEKHRGLLVELEALRAERNAASKSIGATRDPAERQAKIDATKATSDRIGELESVVSGIEKQVRELLLALPNLPDDGVPFGEGESANRVIAEESEKPTFDFEPLPHWDLADGIGLDFERGAKMSGSRFYVLTGELARLQRALITWMLDVHTRDFGFQEIYPPAMLKEESLLASGHLPKFRDNLYRDAEEDYYWIPSAEAPLANLHRDEVLPAGTLPRRMVAYSPCFRREKMSAGRDVRGIKRGHQFDKVELFVYCEPEDSYNELDRLVEQARELPRRLGIPHRVLELGTGDLDFKATKAFDIELWAPGCGEWLEVSSCSNVTDFQARRANIRYRSEATGRPRHPHMLNASGLGLPRTLIAVIENYQRNDGSVRVPDVLLPYMAGTSTIGAESVLSGGQR
ncbi:MAG: serine--tRNA ligase [Dehalococcoidia bacterium]|nr:serine--tRNA ligase [Dehalococcoidia bacterium]